MALLDHEGDREPASASSSGRFRHESLPAYLAGADRLYRPGNDNHTRRGPATSAELDCLRGVLPSGLLEAAARRSQALGISADRVLIQLGAITEDAYLRRLADKLGLRVTHLSDRSDVFAFGADYLAVSASMGIVPIRRGGQLIFAVAPYCRGARGLVQLVADHPGIAARMELTTARDLSQFLIRQRGGHLARWAAHGLHMASPALSAAPPARNDRWHRVKRALRIGGAAALIALPPLFAESIWTSLLAVSFLGFIGLRTVGSLMPRRPAPRRPRRTDGRLPVYTVIIALYREATSVAPLMQAIAALDYPLEKLDVILVTEPDDRATRDAIARLGPLPHMRVMTAPAIGPRTKPKALNFALPFARGSITAVFDAEDRPAPGQLRAVLDAFDDHDNRVACAQAALCIDNASESLIARMFAAEYAGQFDIFLPGLAALRLPLPLGGSSNHFRTDVLRKVGAWDAYNVTEDADLGLRLARFGYRSVTVASTTFEEAPIRIGAWLRQRTRWMKGWMQSWSVHMRNPRQLWRDAGPRGFITINLIVGGNVLTALAYPTLVIKVLALLLSGSLTGRWGGLFIDARMPLHLTAIVAGYVSTVGIGLLGLAYRRQLRHGWVLLLAPIYWGLLSIAAWRALWQLLRDPYRWEKTEHAVSRRSRTMRDGQR